MIVEDVNLLVFVSRSDGEAQAGFQGVGEAAARGGKATGARRIQVGSGAATGCGPANGSGLGTALSRRREERTQARRTGAPTPARCRAGAGIGQGAYLWRFGSRVCDGAMDPAPHLQSERRTVWRRFAHRRLRDSNVRHGLLLP